MYEANVLPLGKVSSSVGTEFGCRLFGKLNEAASAYVIRNADGEGELCLFDTTFARKVLDRPWPDEAEVVLYSNHPEGNMSPTGDDLENLALMPAGARLFIVCEDECVERNTAKKKTE